MIAEINLLPKKVKRSNGSRIYLLSATGLFLIIAIYLVFQYFTIKQDRSLAESQKLQIEAELAELQLELDGALGLQSTSREAAVQIADYISYDVTPIMQDVNARVPQFSYLREYDFSESTVAVQADFEDKTLITLFLTSLQSSSFFTDVTIGEITTFYPSNENSSDSMNFEELPRYSATFTLTIDPNKMRASGVRK